MFEYDPIGNRLKYEGDGIEGAKQYTTNELNQYTATSQPAETPALDAPRGFAALTQGVTTLRVGGVSRVQYDHDVAQENDGNLTRDGKQKYLWDGENRLIAVEPLPPGRCTLMSGTASWRRA